MRKTNALKREIVKFNRAGGQYRRYYGIEPADFIPDNPTAKSVKKALDAMRREAERIKIERDIAERERKEAEERKQAEDMAKVEIDNIVYMIKHMADGAQTALGRIEIQNSSDTILRIIQDARQTWDDVFTAEQLRKWMEKHDRGLERLAYAIYDEEYNTNTRYYEKDDAGDRGRDAYRFDIAELARALKVPVPTLYYVD